MKKNLSGFWPWKFTLKTENALFLTALTQVALQDIKKSSQYVHLDIKIYGISPDSLWFSTTVTALLYLNIAGACGIWFVEQKLGPLVKTKENEIWFLYWRKGNKKSLKGILGSEKILTIVCKIFLSQMQWSCHHTGDLKCKFPKLRLAFLELYHWVST